MCTVITATVRPAAAAVDQRRMVLILDQSLTRAQRIREARLAMSDAGQDQPDDIRDVICVCGLLLDVRPAGDVLLEETFTWAEYRLRDALRHLIRTVAAVAVAFYRSAISA